MTTADEHDRAIIEEIRARGPVWIPAEEAFAAIDRMVAEAEEDEAALRDWDAAKAAGQAATVPHAEVRRRLGLE